jgi:hypothetical protein
VTDTHDTSAATARGFDCDDTAGPLRSGPLMAVLWPETGDRELTAWLRTAGPGATVVIGCYRVTRTADAPPVHVVDGPAGTTWAVDGARPGPRLLATIAADAAGRAR